MNYYDHLTLYCIPSKTSDSLTCLKSHIFVKMYFSSTNPPHVKLSLWKNVQIGGSYRQRHLEAYMQLNIFHLAILNPMWRFYFITFLFCQSPITCA